MSDQQASTDPAGLHLAPGEHPPVVGAIKLASQDMTAHHSARTKARKAALDVLFQADLLGQDPLDALDARPASGAASPRAFTRMIVEGVREHGADIDQRIMQAAAGQWTLERMPRVDRNLARIAVWELDYTDVPTATAISEALVLADELSTDESVAFLNGLLGAVAQSRKGTVGQPDC